jgi:hypothetical protein
VTKYVGLLFHLFHTALSVIRDLFKVAHFGRIITGPNKEGFHCLLERAGERGLCWERTCPSSGDRASGFAIQQRSWYGDVRTFFSYLTNCEQTAICILDILSLVLVAPLRLEGDDIVTCRVARLSQDHFRIELAFCCECGSADLEVCYTSKALGPHLCPTCAQYKVEYGTWKETQTRSPMREQPVA